MSAAAPLYEIRSPEQTILSRVVASELETFLAEQRSAGHEVPRFVGPPRPPLPNGVWRRSAVPSNANLLPRHLPVDAQTRIRVRYSTRPVRSGHVRTEVRFGTELLGQIGC